MIHTLHYRLHEVANYIHWLYFFHAWGFPARFAAVSKVHGCEACRQNWMQTFPTDERQKAAEAIRLYDDAQTMLRSFDATVGSHARIGLFPAQSIGEDIEIETEQGTYTLPLLRQQHGDFLCLSDFIPSRESRRKGTLGLFATSVDECFEEAYPNDDYRHLLCQTLADRLAEATAEKAHEHTRRVLWGFAPDEQLSPDDLFAERYRGKRPAVGYPSLPDQSLNFILNDILKMNDIGITLTESGAMKPHASTSGLIIDHPQAVHFGIGQIGADQLEDYARRRGLPQEKAQRFLASNLRTL